jgi:hypothetical protein
MHPEGSEGTWRDLPRLLGDSMRLVWTSGRKIFLLTSSLQLLAALFTAVQLFVAKAVFEAVLETRQRRPGRNRATARRTRRRHGCR